MLGVMIPFALFCGSIPFGLLIARWKGVDIRAHGSGNIGATNVGRVLGRKWGLVCFALDVFKGFVPTMAAGFVAGLVGRFGMSWGEAGLWLAVMVAAVLGHVFCPWLKFKGGKGVATGLGAMLGVFPAMALPAVVSMVVWGMVFRLSRTVSVASLAAALLMPALVVGEFAAWSAGVMSDGTPRAERSMMGALPFVAVSVALAGLVVYTHRENIARLRAGRELKFGGKAPTSGSVR
jgi:glycerol-3-phosphate acyltransferase PlsY